MRLKLGRFKSDFGELFERITGYCAEEELSGCYVERAEVDLDTGEITLFIRSSNGVSVEEAGKDQEDFCRIASALLGGRVRLAHVSDQDDSSAEDGTVLDQGKSDSVLVNAIRSDRRMSNYLEHAQLTLTEDGLLITVDNTFTESRLLSKREDLRRTIAAVCGKPLRFSIEVSEKREVFPEAAAEEPVEETDREEPEHRSEKKPASSSGIIVGRKIAQPSVEIAAIEGATRDVVVAGEVFNIFYRKNRYALLTFNITDYTDSISCRITGEKAELLNASISEGDTVTVRGKVELDNRYDEEVIVIRDISSCEIPCREDLSEEKRVELHLHTKMSSLDSVVEIPRLFETLRRWGHKTVALTDHGVVQAIPEFYEEAAESGIKPIFGVEGYLINDIEPIFFNLEDRDRLIEELEYVVFDLETTGLHAASDEIIEIGAVKLRGNETVDEFHALVKPDTLPENNIKDMTGISETELTSAPAIKEVLPIFLRFCEGCVLVAHNATFDYRFVRAAVRSVMGEDWSHPYIDTLALSRAMLKTKSHKLDSVASYLNLGSFKHHRGLEDAKITARIFKRFVAMMKKRGIKTLRDMERLKEDRERRIQQAVNHVSILVATNEGLRNLYRLVTVSHTEFFYKKPRIPRSILAELREGLLVGSACISGELSRAYLSGSSMSELEEIAKFFDFIEVMPLDVIDESETEERLSRETLKKMYRDFYKVGRKLSIPVVMTGDVHFIEPRDAIYRAVINALQDYENFDQQPGIYLRTTEEMLYAALEIFEDKEIAREVVISNPQAIAARIEKIEPLKRKLSPPHIDGADEELKKLTQKNATRVYGDTLPEIVEKKLGKELNAIISNKYSVLYIIAQRMVEQSKKDGYEVGSRGSVGSSLAAFLMGITEVNPLPPHYCCEKCRYSEFFEEDRLGSGYDLPDKDCPECGTPLMKNGQNIPFETFMGFRGDKIPDIDLNFSGEYQERAHRFLEELFGKNHVFRAGTISTVAERTAYGFVRAYMEKKHVSLRRAEIDRLVRNVSGVRRTTGQHPGGLMVVPKDRDVHEFTPVQFPANDLNANTMTTHFAYEVIHDDLVKIDALGHDDPTFIKLLKDMTGIDPTTIPMNDEATLSVFSSLRALGLKPTDLGTEVGTLGIPEFGTPFVRGLLSETKPSRFSDLVRISGLSHGTNVWLNNARDLISSGKATLSEVISCRDDIMNLLILRGVEDSDAFRIMESVRKGKGISDEDIRLLKEHDTPEWLLNSCQQIKYLFPKAHAAAYVSMAFRVAYFKVHHPLEFYAAYFTLKGGDFDADLALEGIGEVKRELVRLKAEQDKNFRERSRETILEVIHEMMLRGFSFLSIDLEKSDALKFSKEGNNLRIPFCSLKNFGNKVAVAIKSEFQKKPFTSVEDLVKRTSISKTNVEVLRGYGALKGLPENDQITLF